MEKLSVKNRYSRLKVARKIRPHVAIPAWRALFTRSGWRVMIAPMPPTTAYTAHTKAKRSAKEPNTSTAIPPLPRSSPGLLHTASLGRTCCGALVVLSRGRFILRSAFRLHVLRHKSAVRAGAAFHKGLRLVRKRVRQRICANIGNRKGLSFPFQYEINAPRKVTDTPLLHGTGDAHPLCSRGSAQSLEFGNGVVIGLALAVPKPGEKPQCYHDDSDADAELCLFFHVILFSFDSTTAETAVYPHVMP